MFPVALSYIPLGIACGMALQGAGFSSIAILLMSVLVYAGAAQFMAAAMVTGGASVVSVVVMTFFLNLRYLLMSSSISSYLKNKSHAFMLLFGHTLSDESFGVNIHRFSLNNWSAEKGLAANLLGIFAWIGSNVVGSLIGSTLNIHTVVVNYVLIAMFICMLLEQFVTRTHLIVGLTAGVLSVVLKVMLQHNISLVIAAVIASFVGYMLDARQVQPVRKEEAMQYDK